MRIYTRRQDDIMAFGMRRQFAAWMPAQGGQWWWWWWWFVPLWESQTGIHALFRPVIFYVHAEGLSQEYTHKYCLLACLQAARVWSLLKSPESDSKMSSIRIPAFDLHMSLIDTFVYAESVYSPTDIIGECSKVDCIQYVVISWTS